MKNNLDHEFISENPIWIVTLNDGTDIYGYNHQNWVDLQEYCRAEGKYISGIKLRFRSHWEILPKANGYTFIRSVLGSFGSNRTMNYFVFGFKKDNFYVQKWRVPELIMDTEEERDFDSYKELYIGGSANS